jgi:hypothetical protein
MRFILLVKATPDSEAGVMPTDESLWDEMSRYHAELARAGALLDASGLQPSSRGWRIRFDGDRRTVVDGPFAEAKELVAGYTLIQVASREEAVEWMRRFPNPGGPSGEVEVRPLFDLIDFQPGPGVDRFRRIGLPGR